MSDLTRLLGLGARSLTPTSMSRTPAEEPKVSKSADRKESHHNRPTPLSRVSSYFNLGGHKDDHNDEERPLLQDTRRQARTPQPSKTPAITQQLSLTGDGPGDDRSGRASKAKGPAEESRTWHTPTLMQMAEELQAEIMSSRDSMTPLPPRFNAHILHLVEGVYKFEDKLDKARERRKEAKRERLRDLVQFGEMSKEWIEREHQYKAEIRRLEKLLAQHSDKGMETVALARANSVVNRSDTRRFTAKVHRVSAGEGQIQLGAHQEQGGGTVADLADATTDESSGGKHFSDDQLVTRPKRSLDQLTKVKEKKRGQGKGKQKAEPKLPPLVLDPDHDVKVSEYFRRLRTITEGSHQAARRRRHEFISSPSLSTAVSQNEPRPPTDVKLESQTSRPNRASPSPPCPPPEASRMTRNEEACAPLECTENRSTSSTSSSSCSDSESRRADLFNTGIGQHVQSTSQGLGETNSLLEEAEPTEGFQRDKTLTQADYEAFMAQAQPSPRRSRRFSFTFGDDTDYDVAPRPPLVSHTTDSQVRVSVSDPAGDRTPKPVVPAPGPANQSLEETVRGLPVISVTNTEPAPNQAQPEDPASRGTLSRAGAAKVKTAKRDSSATAPPGTKDGSTSSLQAGATTATGDTVATDVSRSRATGPQSELAASRDRAGGGGRVPTSATTSPTPLPSSPWTTTPPSGARGSSETAATPLTTPDQGARIAATRAVERMNRSEQTTTTTTTGKGVSRTTSAGGSRS
ncbi:uncharacterized protein E0L32_004688 [Thyridium curvatum]|uniref:Uncharacterized protein n=1 Tax=Thyridium curvatum TaxID=1093900 RepID=A0A507BF19_9PEZI|nr:uncharacterized protein E0L32_004688 [Thyridium curvatum]TPX15130.1 hypothetical protein E0L32_004688 [Thyridium curvatum]